MKNQVKMLTDDQVKEFKVQIFGTFNIELSIAYWIIAQHNYLKP